MMFANAIEQGNESMIEDVEEVFERRVLLRLALDHQFRTGNVECAKAAGESKEVDAHLRGRLWLVLRGEVVLAFDLGDVAGGKLQVHRRAEADDLFSRIGALCG